LDRIDELIEFDLPSVAERKQLIVQYMEQYLLNPPNKYAKRVTTQDIGEAEIQQVAEMTEGFSGRAISKLAIAWQAAAYGTSNAILDKQMLLDTVTRHQRSARMKEQWIQKSATPSVA
jgi:ATPase family AAA domain-containing protein 3A/B